VSGNGGVGETIAVAVMTQSGFTQASEPVFNGCYIEGGVSIGNTYAVQAAGYSNASFQYCLIVPGSSTSGSSFGIYFTACEVHVQSGGVVGVVASAATSAVGVYGKNGILELVDCHVAGGYAGANTTGVYSDNCSGYIRNSTVYGGKGSTTSTGVLLTGADLPYVRNCTVNGGGSTSVAYGILAYTSGAIIENCIIWSDNLATWSCAVAMYGISSETLPSALNNCDLFNTKYWYGYSPDNNVTWYCFNATSNGGIPGMQSHLTGLGKSSSLNFSWSSVGFVNTAVDLTGSNWDLTASTPSFITTGGKNFSSLFTDDKAGDTRPATGSWSMGAYQYP
jgi:hypothetical protein